MLRESGLLLVLAAAAALGANIKIEWVEDSPGGPSSQPRLVGLEQPSQRGGMIGHTFIHLPERKPVTQEEWEAELDAENAFRLQLLFEQVWTTSFLHAEDVWFAASKQPRAKRPPKVTHPVGTVYLHQKTGARGVVIGWDERTTAPREWVDATDAHGQHDWKDRIARLHEPHYSVLEEKVGDDGRVQYLERYVVSRCRKRLAPPSCLEIQAAPGKPLTHPDLDKYFSHYDSERGVYVPNERLAALYPEG
jgi:hemimethylated DNA binding protein